MGEGTGFWTRASKRVGMPRGQGHTDHVDARDAWPDELPVEVDFCDKGSAAGVKKSQVTVQHDSLKDAKAAERVEEVLGGGVVADGQALGA